MPFDPDLADQMRAALKRRTHIDEKRMFGGIAWMLRGNMLCGVEGRRFMFRVGKDLEAEALARPGARPMDFTGKPMRGFVWVTAAPALETGLRSWIDLAACFVGKLPPK
jgi:TfoX/Sxy family transcriptional regulator of competence genes